MKKPTPARPRAAKPPKNAALLPKDVKLPATWGSMEQAHRAKPQRIQRKRTKGYRLPPGTVVVTRPTKWGNPFLAKDYHYGDGEPQQPGMNAWMVELYRRWITEGGDGAPTVETIRRELRGKHLACYCPLTDAKGNRVPCHADVLLEIANA